MELVWLPSDHMFETLKGSSSSLLFLPSLQWQRQPIGTRHHDMGSQGHMSRFSRCLRRFYPIRCSIQNVPAGHWLGEHIPLMNFERRGECIILKKRKDRSSWTRLWSAPIYYHRSDVICVLLDLYHFDVELNTFQTNVDTFKSSSNSPKLF